MGSIISSFFFPDSVSDNESLLHQTEEQTSIVPISAQSTIKINEEINRSRSKLLKERMKGKGRDRDRGTKTQKRKNQNPSSMQRILNDDDNIYSASSTSSGSGYFGETQILKKNINNNNLDLDLPSNAMDILNSIEIYLENITNNEIILNKLSNIDKKLMINSWNVKLKNNLNDLIINKKMSINAYLILKDIFNSLNNNEYDDANNKLLEIIKNTKEFKQNKKWIMTFKYIIRIAKQYNI